MIKQLGSEHLTAMRRLRMSKPKHAGFDVSQYTSSLLLHINPRYFKSPHFAVGSFTVSGKLDSFILCHTAADFWVLDLMVNSTSVDTLKDCLAECIAYYERQNIFKFYYAFPQKWQRAYRSIWREHVPALQKYTVNDLWVLPANRRPPQDWIWQDILHEIVVPVPLLLRCSVYEP